MSREMPTGNEFRSRFISIVSICSTSAAVLTTAYLATLLRMPREQVTGLLWIVAIMLIPTTPATFLIYTKTIRPVMDWLDGDRDGTVPPERLREAFETVIKLPVRVMGLSYLFFVAPAFAGLVTMWLRFEAFRIHSATLMFVGVLSAGLLASIVEAFVLKRWLDPMRRMLALALVDPEERNRLAGEVSLVAKLQIVVASCTIVPVAFAVFMAHSHSAIPVERLAVELQRDILDEAERTFAEGGEGALRSFAEGLSRETFPARLLVYDRNDGTLLLGDDRPLMQSERRRLVEAEQAEGSSDVSDTDVLLSWRQTGDGLLVFAVASERQSLFGDRSEIWIVFGGLFVVCLAIALAIGWLVAEDIGGAMRRLHQAVDRMSAGDLRRIEVLESEDELGTLARSFDSMTASLRDSVGDVASSADVIEAKAEDMAGVSQGLLVAASEQGREVKQVVSAMEEVGSQVSGIAASSRELNLLVEESTSSLLELGSSGEQLNQTAGVLSSRVDEVSSSIEQMVRSVREVGTTTGSLAEAAGETSSSMEEMASSMRLVDTTATQTMELSLQVVSAAERGQEKVRVTIDGMQSIRVATDTAQQVIHSLGSRAEEIGSILDVIEDVADETNLLALNAAIIAAQAGEHGRAFSVVADEIKELADRVLASTKEIDGLIRSVQEESRSAIVAIEEGSRSVADGVKRSTEAGEVLEEITEASRNSGLRIREIVDSVKEQTTAAGHVVELMDRVSEGVEAIQRASEEQERGNQVVSTSTQSMREVAQQLHATTSEQSKGLSRIRESVEGVRDAIEQINTALDGQSSSCHQVVGFLEEVSSRSMANESSARQVGDATQELLGQSQSLRDNVGRFKR